MFPNLRTAFSFLTIFPISIKTENKESSLPRAMIFFPLVGFCIGLIALAFVFCLEPFVPPRTVNLLLVLIPIILSGGLHMDGLSDSFDALFQGRGREDILRVMKDSRIGVWGTLSILFTILFKWELLMILPWKNLSFLFALSASRWSHVVICFLLPYARQEAGLGKQVAGLVKRRELILSTLCVVLPGLFLGFKGVVVLILTIGFIYLLSRFYKRKLNGITGDIIGATGELTEVFVYISVIAIYESRLF